VTLMRSKITLWVIEAIIALNVLYLSGYPLIVNPNGGFGGDGIEAGVENFLTGNGPYTLSFWFRIASIIAAVLILVNLPRKTASKRSLRIRIWSDFALAVLFFYVVSLSIIFGNFSDYLWIQPVVYATIMSIAYVANSWWYND
jgi:hypothetical protein